MRVRAEQCIVYEPSIFLRTLLMFAEDGPAALSVSSSNLQAANSSFLSNVGGVVGFDGELKLILRNIGGTNGAMVADSQSTVQLSNCHFIDNAGGSRELYRDISHIQTESCGAISSAASSLSISSTEFTDNTACTCSHCHHYSALIARQGPGRVARYVLRPLWEH